MFTLRRKGLCRREDILNIYYLILPKNENSKDSNRSMLFRGANEKAGRIGLMN
jgi:hypothetical protein